MKTKSKGKRRGKVKMVGLIILAVIAALMLVGTLLHFTYFRSKKNSIEPYGQLVDVFDGKMHVYQMGNGKKTIVLLPGLGDALPSADFGPLMRSLSKDYTVACVEYFGVGFSTQTKRERICDNYVEEIRAALSNAGIKGPYVLMPHSISSVYSEYYAAKYPSEVEAIISLDGTSSAYVGDMMPGFAKALIGVSKFQQAIGFSSILATIATNRSKSLEYGYTEKEINDLITYAGFSMNDNVLDQMRNSYEFVKTTNETTYPLSVPYFKIISKQTYETPNKQIKMTPQQYQEEHLARVGAENNFKVLDGTHFIYQNNADEIKRITDAFILEN